MRVVNFGSINIDHVYRVDHMVQKGETIACSEYAVFGGGKGANQSIALGRAGAAVLHVGKVGREGAWLVSDMQAAGVDVSGVKVDPAPGGHAIIQVDQSGQNSIVIHGGTNQLITREEIDAVLKTVTIGDMVLLQNEISNVQYIIAQCADRKIPVCFNPAPIDPTVAGFDLQGVSVFVVNETEGETLSGKKQPEEIVETLLNRYPAAEVVLTLGGDGVLWGKGSERVRVPAVRVKAVDTTAAGDTFIGFLLAGLQKGMSMSEALRCANTAAAISVTRKGAASSIPAWNEVAAAGF